MSEKPVIGVTGPDRGGLAAWLMTSMAVRRAGGIPVRITPKRNCSPECLDGIVIGGGSDVEPFHYGEEPEYSDNNPPGRYRFIDWLVSLLVFMLRFLFRASDVQRYDPDRDQLEKRLIQYGLRYRLPLLGICRGAQLLNVVLGGTLYQKIHEFYGEEPYIRTLLPRKKIHIEPDTRLAQILDGTSGVINALHHQAIKNTGEGVRIAARDKAGVVQAIECTGDEFVLGVQWHPEYLPQSAQHQALFRELVRAASGRSLKQPGERGF